MAETEDTLTFNFIEDDPTYYLVGDQITHSKMFRSYTMAGVQDNEADYPPYVLNLADFRDRPEADKLITLGWQRTVFIGKLMTSSRASEEAEVEENIGNNKKSASQEKLEKLVRQKTGFSTGLFVIQPLFEQYDGDFRAEQLLGPDIPQLVASTHNIERQTLRIIPADREEHYYDDQYGTKIKDLKAVGAASWTAIEKLHRFLYDLLSDEIADRRPG